MIQKPEGETRFSALEAADELLVSRQRIHQMIYHGRLEAHKVKNHWYISREALDAYLASKHSRAKHYTEDFLSIPQAAQYLKCTMQRLYYLMRTGIIAYERANPKYKKTLGIQKDELDGFVRIYQNLARKGLIRNKIGSPVESIPEQKKRKKRPLKSKLKP